MKTRLITLAAAVALTTQLSGCWFVFIPGALMSRAADAVTGATGEHCVGEAAKVGGRIALPGGGTATIKSLSGTSSRCTDPRWPIRAALVAD